MQASTLKTGSMNAIAMLKQNLKKYYLYVLALGAFLLMYGPDYAYDMLLEFSNEDSFLWSYSFQDVFFNVSFALRVLGVLLLGFVIDDSAMGGAVSSFYWKSRAYIARRRAYFHFQAQKFEQAIEDCTQAMRLDPTSRQHVYSRGLTYCAMQNFDAGIEDFSAAIKIAPTYADAYCARGRASMEKKEFNQAIADFSEVIRLNPKNSACYLLRALAYQQSEKLDEALKDYASAIQFHPNDYFIYVNRALLWDKRQDHERFMDDCRRAIQIDPSLTPAYISIAWVKSTNPIGSNRDGQLAVEYATKACELSEWKVWQYLGTLAAAYAEAGDFQNAVHWAEKSIAVAPMEEKAAATKRLSLYQSHKPYRELSGQLEENLVDGIGPR